VIVLDASVVVELLIRGPLAESLSDDLARRDDSFLAPHLLDVEVVNAVRNLVAGQRLDPGRAGRLLQELDSLPVTRLAHSPLLGRMWELRHNFTAYDAAYIALAEAADAVLYTCDRKLRKGHRARVKLFCV
jgi:predicted nucleic acid-binding protein